MALITSPVMTMWLFERMNRFNSDTYPIEGVLQKVFAVAVHRNAIQAMRPETPLSVARHCRLLVF